MGAAVVLAQVAVEVTLAWVVHVLTQFQEPAMRTWTEGLRIETLIDRDERRLFNALIAETGETIEGEAATSWSQPDRRPYTIEGRLSFYGAPGVVFPPGVAPTFGRWGSGRRAPRRP